ncbi:E3 ubiquitin-protein ligase HERC2 isoform X1, partial [Tachysurus ichikawai]
SRPASKGVEGLAQVGSRAALSFAFAFLRRAWRSGKQRSNLISASVLSIAAIPGTLEALRHTLFYFIRSASIPSQVHSLDRITPPKPQNNTTLLGIGLCLL